jgi:hypothetical protein
MTITQRAAGNAASRWVPAIGAAAVASYAYWDTLQVAKTARKLLDPPLPPPSPSRPANPAP